MDSDVSNCSSGDVEDQRLQYDNRGDNSEIISHDRVNRIIVCTMDLTQEEDDHKMDISDIAMDLPLTSVGIASSSGRGRPDRPRRMSVGSSEDKMVKKTTALEKQAEKQAEKSAEKQAKKPAEKQAEKPAEKQAEKQAKNPAEKQAEKQQLAQVNTAKKVGMDKNKVYKAGGSMTHMTIEAHPSLCESWYMGDVSREAAAAGAALLAAPALCHPALLVWTRAVPRTLHAAEREVQLTSGKENCDRALYVATAEEVAEHVSEHSLAHHLAQIRDMAGCTMTLVVFGVKDYFKSSRRKTSNSNKSHMTEIDLEMAIADLMVSGACDTAIVNTPNELALLIVQFTKAIAEAPSKKAKRACDEQAEFYMRGDNKKCVAVDKDGVGVGRLWQQMIAILPMSSLETSRALCAQYKSPLALYQALQSPDSVNEIAGIGVARAAVPGSRARRVGPEFAKKLRTIFTAQDGNVLVD